LADNGMNYSDYFKLLDTDYNGTISFKDLLRVILPVCSSEVQAGFLQQGSVDVS
jgi:Ca2+-binding EF-hand superfamily protein